MLQNMTAFMEVGNNGNLQFPSNFHGFNFAATKLRKANLFNNEMAQMVCGSCHRLLSYPRGTRHVKCSCCQTVNLVLEADQVGQVKCGSCAVLLMYPYGALQVRCSTCQFVTKIEEHNKRPPWSVLQLQGKPTSTPTPPK